MTRAATAAKYEPHNAGWIFTMQRIVACSLCTLFLTVSFALAADSPTPAAKADPVDPASVKLQILDYDGLQKLIAGHRGKVVVMDCWATYCVPCVKEFPNLVALNKKRSTDGLACISLSLDFDGTGKPEDVQPNVLKFLQKREATFDNVLSSVEADGLCKKLEFAAPPAVFVFDRQGKLRKRFDHSSAVKDGPFSYEQVGALVDELLKDKP